MRRWESPKPHGECFGGGIRKAVCAGTGCSVVELNDVPHIFAAVVPGSGGTFRQQARGALLTVHMVMDEEGGHGGTVSQTIFLARQSDAEECRQMVHHHYGPHLPATSYIPQAPCGGELLAIEALGVSHAHAQVEIERVNAQLVICRNHGMAWAHCALVQRQPRPGDIYDDALDAFAQIRRLLGSVSIPFDQVIRTWLYLGGIVEGDGPRQRYRELNRARDDFYREIPFRRFAGARPQTGYPASTGIGIEGRGIMMSGIALATDREDVIARPLENPRQTAAYNYALRYSAQSPKFSRAMALSCGSDAIIFISGTASITDSASRHEEDAVAQVHQTLDNIAALLGEDNLSNHGLPGLGTTLDGLTAARVYIKRPADYAGVRAVCERRLGELPTVYAVANVCRPELLVEIEGIACSHKAPAGIY